ncbi:MAG: EAL domain-containing protein [Rhizorhabdus sp.]|uniref:putative bifunctional diguanylate cyclase/phosphodiesterase n=1 Tax=Rhizorhabdus sp. TaxID=1968843 RepID=UPI001B7C0619|nr:EAL domain-containing protein [Rhizorhabdus sp.]MBP8233186.1 EAL domain-containing protein [Rhizorhabdus sp.]
MTPDRFTKPRERMFESGDFTRPLATTALVVLVAAAAMIMVLVGQVDRDAAVREQAILLHGVESRFAELAASIRPQLAWDEAVERLDHRFDPLWARDNLGVYLTQNAGFETVTLLDRANRPIFSHVAEGISLRPPPLSEAAVDAVIAKARRSERERRTSPDQKMAGQAPPPPYATGTARIGGQVHLVIAMIVSPDLGHVRPLGKTAPLVLVTRRLDRSFLDLIAARFLIRGLHYREGEEGLGSHVDEARIDLTDAAGKPVASLGWEPARPSAAVLGRLKGPLFLLLLLLCLSVFALHRRTRRMARGLMASEARATHIAFHDMLTGMPNRTLFVRRLHEVAGRNRREGGVSAILCLNLDRFREANDTYGHVVGDELIRRVGARLLHACRQHEMLARFSADEFAILLENATPDGAARLADRLCATVAEPFALGIGALSVTCTIGIAMLSDGDTDPEEVVRQADMALLRAKTEARGQYRLFDAEVDASVRARRILEQDLSDALRDGGLRVEYQPQVNPAGLTVGVEALVRWTHPAKGEISPALFVPVAEQSGLIERLGLFVLRQAFEDSKNWLSLRVAVNISSCQLHTEGFVDRLGELVRDIDVDPRMFDLEITEGVFLRDDRHLREKLARLRDLGFGLALDDFGTGYSSLGYLRSYPITKIKIDRSFVIGIGAGEASDQVIGAIIRLATALRLGIVAEGVETEAQWAWLLDAGCRDGQGHLFARAMPADAITERLRREAAQGGSPVLAA